MKVACLVIASLSSMLPTSLPAQESTMPTPLANGTAPAAEMSDKDKATLKRCQAMTYGQIQQSSKCVKLLKQAGTMPPKPEQPRQ